MEKLYIPMGIKSDAEIFTGFGRKELYKSIVASLVCAAIAIVYYLISGNVTATVVSIFTTTAGSVFAFTKDNTNLSVAAQLMNMARFAKSQKVYRYRALDEWST
ncbi:hypothetical protein FACS1894202_11480 [Clostridia bacterium]|nr:hypothetical protein FACS1894202_11480 [Clostridia bacterium]